MPSETGHAKNVANFETLVNIIIALGAIYQPSNPTILLTALQALLALAKSAMNAVGTKEAEETNAAKLRETAFEGHSKLATRVANAYNAGASDELVSSNIAGYLRELRGKRKGKKTDDDPATPEDESANSISVSQVSYDNLIATWRLLLQLLETQAGYNPNEPELKIDALIAYVDDLEAKNNAAKIASIAAKNARTNRDEILYNSETGMLEAVGKVKKYVKSLANQSAVYAQLTALKFKRG